VQLPVYLKTARPRNIKLSCSNFPAIQSSNILLHSRFFKCSIRNATARSNTKLFLVSVVHVLIKVTSIIITMTLTGLIHIAIVQQALSSGGTSPLPLPGVTRAHLISAVAITTTMKRLDIQHCTGITMVTTITTHTTTTCQLH
jgi:hypothetical protein